MLEFPRKDQIKVTLVNFSQATKYLKKDSTHVESGEDQEYVPGNFLLCGLD